MKTTGNVPDFDNLSDLGLKNINTAIFLETLHNNGFKNISIKELNFLISHMVERLKLIAEAKVYKEKIKLEKSLYFNFRNEMKIKNDLNLIFISKIYYFKVE